MGTTNLLMGHRNAARNARYFKTGDIVITPRPRSIPNRDYQSNTYQSQFGPT